MREALLAARTRLGVAYSLAVEAVPQFAISLALFGVVELAALLLAQSGIDWMRWLGGEVADQTFRDLLGGGVGVIGALLGLYYATVGVVASTVYQAVPSSIRTLFLEEPSGTVYVSGVVRAVVFGIAALTGASVGLAPSPLGLVVFAMLVVTALLRLMILGGRIFNFFDPSSLAISLGNRFAVAMRRAASGGVRDESAQATAHAAAQSALSTYFDLAILLEDRKGRSAAGPRRLTTQLIQLTAMYASAKSKIPTKSAWWAREPSHRNWMTLDYTRLELSLNTGTGIAPELSPNRLWVEEAVARVLDRTFAAAFRAGGSASALDFAGNMAGITWHLASQLQVEEALTLERVWSKIVAAVTSGPSEERDPLGINKLAAAEQIVMPLTNLWLGLADGAERVASVDLSEVFRHGRRDPAGPYGQVLPPAALDLLEQFVARARDEEAADGVLVTPDWWRNHLLARSVVKHVVVGYEAFRAEVDGPLEVSTNEYVSGERFDLAAVVSIASLELFNKVEANFYRVQGAIEKLDQYRNETGDKAWAVLPDGKNWAAEGRRNSLRRLAVCLPELRVAAHDPHRPDLHGQVFQYVFDATFSALLDGDVELAKPLFFAVFMEADQMRLRVAADLADHDDRTKVAFALDPIVGLMELSGYARLMQEVDGKGIWNEVRGSWDVLLDSAGGQERAGFFLTAADAVDSLLAMSPGSVMRVSRSQQLHRVLEARGIVARDWSPWTEPPDPTTLRSPIVEAFAPGDLGINDDLADLFLADYLSTKLPKDTKLPWRAQSLVEELNANKPAAGPPRNRRSRGRPRRASTTDEPSVGSKDEE